jgi:hypothetical protein
MKKILTLILCGTALTGCGRKVTYINLPQTQSGQPVRVAQDVYARQDSNTFTYPGKQHLNIKHGDLGHIYFALPNFSPFIKKIGNENCVQIKPLSCIFSTAYTGKIKIQITEAHNLEPLFKTITNDTPFTYVFDGFHSFIPDMSIYSSVMNIGCNATTDGDKCIHAIEKQIDNLNIVCHEI